jgi:outer membrane protein OmpA-like peptidoglycan-associated protein
VPLEPDGGGLGLGLLAALDLPTGDPTTYRGTDGIAGLVALSGTVEGGPMTVSFLAGGRAAPNTSPEERPAPTVGGDTFEGHLALAGLASSGVGIGVEGRVSVPFDAAVRTAIGTTGEAMGTLRFVTSGGGHVLAGVGVGIGQGAGASPLRLVVGGGFGSSSGATSADSDGDGVTDARDTCPDGAETVNGYDDADACPDVLPQVSFMVVVDGVAIADAQLVAVGPTGESFEGVGQVVASGLPGETVQVRARAGSCRVGEAMAQLPAAGSVVVQVPVVVETGEVEVSVTDAAGRAMEGAMVKYLATDPACAPEDTTLRAGRGTHRVGVGLVTAFVTAAGYDVQQFDVEVTEGERGTVEAVLSPTQVSRRGSQVTLAEPIVFLSDSAIIDEASTPLLQQLATVILTEDLRDVQVKAWGEGSSSRRLAEARGEAVVAFLESLGVPGDRLSVSAQSTLPKGQADRVRFVVR